MSFGLDKVWRQHMVNECLLRAQKRATAKSDKINSKTGSKFLDLATGTADVVLEINALSKAPVEVLGVDPSAQMLKHGIKKIEKSDRKSKLKLALGDAQDLREVEVV